MQTVFAQNTDAKKPQLVRRHSSGDHAFLPQRHEVEAMKVSKKNGGVQEGQIQDSAVCQPCCCPLGLRHTRLHHGACLAGSRAY
jgi:hypothetical protein